MYILFGILILVCLVFVVFCHWKKKKISCRLNHMPINQKVGLINRIAEPFGFCYSPSQDIITTRVDAWQRKFGYCALYDKSALHFSMVFDCEPIYFNYCNKTWLIEFWKGQYGVSLGSEIGIYCADRELEPWEYERTPFHSITDRDFLELSLSLSYKGTAIFSASQPHWWLTGFCPGRFCDPENLVMQVSISFKSEKMMCCFLQGLYRTGIPKCCVTVRDLTVSFSIARPCSRQPRCHKRLAAAWAQWKNRLFCKLYRMLTKPFTNVLDQLLYLYFFLPWLFRRMLCKKRNRKQKFKKPHRKEWRRHGI